METRAAPRQEYAPLDAHIVGIDWGYRTHQHRNLGVLQSRFTDATRCLSERRLLQKEFVNSLPECSCAQSVVVLRFESVVVVNIEARVIE